MRVRLADCARALCPSRLFSFKESCAVEKMRGEDGEDGAASTNSTFLTLYTVHSARVHQCKCEWGLAR